MRWDNPIWELLTGKFIEDIEQAEEQGLPLGLQDYILEFKEVDSRFPDLLTSGALDPLHVVQINLGVYGASSLDIGHFEPIRFLLGFPHSAAWKTRSLAFRTIGTLLGPYARFYLKEQRNINAAYYGAVSSFPMDTVWRTVYEMAAGRPARYGDLPLVMLVPFPEFSQGDYSSFGTQLSPEDRIRVHMGAPLHEFGHAFFNPIELYPLLKEYTSGQTDVFTLLRALAHANLKSELAADVTHARLMGSVRAVFQERALIASLSATPTTSTLPGGQTSSPGYVFEVIDPNYIEDPNSTYNQRLSYVLNNLQQITGRDPQSFQITGNDPQLIFQTLDEIRRFANSDLRDSLFDLRNAAAQFPGSPTDPVIHFFKPRLWIQSWLLGYARPDLIGKKVSLDHEGYVTVLDTGEVIDPDTLNVPAISEIFHLDDPELYTTPLHRAVRERLRPFMEGPIRISPTPQPGEDPFEVWKKWFLSVLGEEDIFGEVLNAYPYVAAGGPPWSRITHHPLFRAISSAHTQIAANSSLADLSDVIKYRTFDSGRLDSTGLYLTDYLLLRAGPDLREQIVRIAAINPGNMDYIRVMRTLLGDQVPLLLKNFFGLLNNETSSTSFIGYARHPDAFAVVDTPVDERNVWELHPPLAFTVELMETPESTLVNALAAVGEMAYAAPATVGDKSTEEFITSKITPEEYLYRALRTRLVGRAVGQLVAARLMGAVSPLVRHISELARASNLLQPVAFTVMEDPSQFEDENSPMWRVIRQKAEEWIDRRRQDLANVPPGDTTWKDLTGLPSDQERDILQQIPGKMEDLPYYMHKLTNWFMRSEQAAGTNAVWLGQDELERIKDETRRKILEDEIAHYARVFLDLEPADEDATPPQTDAGTPPVPAAPTAPGGGMISRLKTFFRRGPDRKVDPSAPSTPMAASLEASASASAPAAGEPQPAVEAPYPSMPDIYYRVMAKANEEQRQKLQEHLERQKRYIDMRVDTEIRHLIVRGVVAKPIERDLRPLMRPDIIAFSYLLSKAAPQLRGKVVRIDSSGKMFVGDEEVDQSFLEGLFERLPDVEEVQQLLPEGPTQGFVEDYVRERLDPVLRSRPKADAAMYTQGDAVTLWQMWMLEQMGHGRVLEVIRKVFHNMVSAEQLQRRWKERSKQDTRFTQSQIGQNDIAEDLTS